MRHLHHWRTLRTDWANICQKWHGCRWPCLEAGEWMRPFQPYDLLAAWDELPTTDKSVGIDTTAVCLSDCSTPASTNNKPNKFKPSFLIWVNFLKWSEGLGNLFRKPILKGLNVTLAVCKLGHTALHFLKNYGGVFVLFCFWSVSYSWFR